MHNSQWQREVGVSGSVQGPQDEWSGGGYLQEGGRSCVMPGLQSKEDNGRIYEHSDNESPLSVTILNLVRGKMREAVSGGQVGRFNATVPQS